MDILKTLLLIDLARFAERNDIPSFSEWTEMRDFLKPIIDGNNGFQLYVNPFDTHKRAIEALDRTQECSSCAVLIALTLEEDINQWVRFGCYIKSYSHSQIDDLLKSVSLKVKVNFILPLIGIIISEQYKSALFDFQKVRNDIVHNKSNPELWRLEGQDKVGSTEANLKKAESLVKRYPLSKLAELSEQTYDSFNEIDSVKRAIYFLNRYFDMAPKPNNERQPTQ